MIAGGHGSAPGRSGSGAGECCLRNPTPVDAIVEMKPDAAAGAEQQTAGPGPCKAIA